MTSMTGYSYSEKNYENSIVSVEIKSVNSRFLDLSINLPPYLNSLESFFRSCVCEKVVRGKVDVNIRIKELSSDVQIDADVSLASAYLSAIKKIASIQGVSQEIPLSLVISQPGVLTVNKNYDVEKYKSLILPVFTEALENVI